MGQYVHRGGVGTNSSRVDPRLALLDRVIVNQIARFKVVGGIEDEIGGCQQFSNVGRNKIGNVCLYVDAGVELCDLAASGLSLWK